jgi:hypothetical protein
MVRFNALKPYTTRVVACGRDATIVKTTAPPCREYIEVAEAVLRTDHMGTSFRGSPTCRRHLRPCHKEQRWRDRVESLVQRLTGAAQMRSTAAALPEVFDGEHSADDKA